MEGTIYNIFFAVILRISLFLYINFVVIFEHLLFENLFTKVNLKIYHQFRKAYHIFKLSELLQQHKINGHVPSRRLGRSSTIKNTPQSSKTKKPVTPPN